MRKLPDGYPHRLCLVPGWNNWFHVPMYIVRCDSLKTNGSATHGWQVRYSGSKFFSDSVYDARFKNPQSALDAATQYLAARFKGRNTCIRMIPLKSKKSPIKDVGIRLVSKKPRDRNVSEYYMEVTNMSNKLSPKRIYVGTDNTISEERIALALSRAREERSKLITAHLKNHVVQPRNGDLSWQT